MSRPSEIDFNWRKVMADKSKEQPKQPSKEPVKHPSDPKGPPVKPQGDVDNPGRGDNPPPPPNPPGGGG